MGSAGVMLDGVMPEQQTKARIWPLVWVVKLTCCVRLKQSNIALQSLVNVLSVLSK